ncbi:MAG: hypothetical protein K9J17_02795 [Flavobacteriales bacterium]|nr:hypothetical protein [Flavobacteriales bacterium]
MRKRLRPTTYLFILIVLAASYSSCDLINPEETIPGFLRIDSISLATTSVESEGHPVPNLVDAWVFDDDQLVGIYELPAIVPILRNGDANIRIRGGIKLNGLVGSRVPLLFSEDYQATLEMFPDSQLHVNPTLHFHDWVTFSWLEDFDNVGLSIEASAGSDGTTDRVSGVEALDGNSFKMALSADELLMECSMTGNMLELPSGGAPVFLDFSYKNNNPFVVGLFSSDATGTIQTSLIVLNPSEDWNHIFVNLTDAVSANASYTGHRPFFGFVRDETVSGEAYVYLDNIRLIH